MNRASNDSHGLDPRLAVALVLSSLMGISLRSQSPPPGASTQPEQFEVASIRPAAPGGRGGGAYLLMPGGSFVGKNLPVKRLVMEAYGVTDFQITGGPGWIDSERYDIDAKGDELTRADQLSLPMRALLVDRFRLKIHRTTKILPIFVLTVGKSGLKIHPSERPDPGKSRFVSGTRISGDFTVAEFAKKLQPLLGRSVIDTTELSGEYEVNLEWTPDPGQGQPVWV